MLGKPSRRTTRHLEATGRRATATVLEISDRGMSVSTGDLVSQTEVVLKTTLSVQPEGEPAFEVTKRLRFGQMAIPGVGQKLGVRYDPEDHDKLMIDELSPVIDVPGLPGGRMDVGDLLSTIKQTRAQAPGDRMAMADALKASLGLDATGFAPPAAAPDTVGQLERLAALHASGALTDAEFTAEKAKVMAV